MLDQVIFIDDEPNIRKTVEALFLRQGYNVHAFDSFKNAREVLNSEDVDVVLTDLSMPEESGLDILSYCKQYSPDLPVLILTAHGTIDSAVQAMKLGAHDFIVKPFAAEELFRIVKSAIESRKRRKKDPEVGTFDTSLFGALCLPLIGNSDYAKNLRAQVDELARSDLSLLITGADGIGKRSVAVEIHRRSIRRSKPCIFLNCGAVPPSFQVNELFGAEKGVTPGVFFSRPGRLELAQEGTLILEEIQHLSFPARALLSEALEEEKFSRSGGWHSVPLTARLISLKTGRDESILSQTQLDLIPVNERREDIPTWISVLVERACYKKGEPLKQVSSELLHYWQNQDWPGNFGELSRAITLKVQSEAGNLLLL